MPPSAKPPQPGDTLGAWTLRSTLGMGGMAVVYRADGPKGPAAVKVLHQTRVTADEIKRFQREFITLDRLEHPNIVRVYEAGQHDGFPWIAMELVEGTDLGTLLERWETEPPADRFGRVESLFAQLADALAYVHERGAIHRDLKPGNVLVGNDGRAHLTDFGVVKDPEAFPTSLTMAGRIVGTVAFMAPEQITGEATDARADLYSLGAILYVMLTGRRPIVADSIAGYLARHLAETPTAPSEIDPRVPARLERVCMRLLQKEPAQRYASARDALAALQDTAGPVRPPIQGREGPLAEVLSRVTRLLQTGVGGLLAVVGRTGAGHSRVLEEIAGRAQDLGADTVVSGPHDAFASLRRALSGQPGLDGAAESSAPPAAERPRVFVLDDPERAPDDLQQALRAHVRRHLAAEGGPLLVVFPDRGAGRVLDPLTTGLDAEEVALPPLDRDAVRALLRDRGLHGALGATLARRLHEELAGSPALIVEQMDTLVRTGVLTPAADGTLRAAGPVEALRTASLPIPERVLAAEAAFRADLPPDQGAVLDALAVLDAPSPIPVIAAVARLDESATQSVLRTLSTRGLAACAVEALGENWSVEGRRRAQVLRECLPGDRRSAMHRAAADVLLRVHRRRLGAVAEVAAAHLVAGGDRAGAYPLLVQAAQRAGRRGEHAAARDLCGRAEHARTVAESVLSVEEAQRWHRQLGLALGDALRALGNLAAARDAYLVALSVGSSSDDPAVAARARAGAGLCALGLGDSADASGALETALVALEQGEALWPEVARAVGTLRLAAGNADGARALFRACAELGEGTHNAVAEIAGLRGLSLLATLGGQPDEANALLDRAVERGRDAAVPGAPAVSDALAEALHQRARGALDAGEWSRALRLADTIESLAESSGTASTGVLAGTVRTVALDGLGERNAAARAARELLTTLRLHDVRWLVAWGDAVRVLSDGGEAEETAARLAQGGWIPDPPADIEAARDALLALALVSRRSAAAREHAHAALARLSGRPGGAVLARIELDAAKVLARAHDGTSAGAAALRALERLEDVPHRALVIEACRIAAVHAPSPRIDERLRRAEGRSG